MEDREILSLYLARDEAAITQTAEKYGGYCGSIANNILQNEQDAEECLDDAWLAAWNSIPPQQPENLAAFLGKITRRKAIDRWRRARCQKRGEGSVPAVLDELANCIPAGDSPEQALQHKELSQAIERFLSTLPVTERSVFLCRYWYFDSLASICGSFGFSQSKVKSMLHRTRKKLQQFLQKEELL